MRSVVMTSARTADNGGLSTQRRVVDIVWAVLPGVALALVFVFTWRLMHGTQLVIPSAPSATQ